jgi:hypothetical protein
MGLNFGKYSTGVKFLKENLILRKIFCVADVL